MNKLSKTRLYLSSLTVYRTLLADETVQRYMEMLDAAENGELSDFSDAYGAFYSGLLKHEGGPDFAARLEQLARYDDNAFSRAAANSDDAAVERMTLAALRDFETLNMIAALSCDDIKAAVKTRLAETKGAAEFIDGLPEFSSRNEWFSVKTDTMLRRSVMFYRENGFGLFARFGAFRWWNGRLTGIAYPDPIRLSDLKDYEYERGLVVSNTLNFLDGADGGNLLLYGDRGTGKSSTVKAIANEYRNRGLRIVEVAKDSLTEFPALLGALRDNPLKFLVFIDDLSFSTDDDSFSALKSVLEGGLVHKPDNCLIYATSNRRHLVKESFSERNADDVHAGDTMQEKLSLSDRFAMTVNFYAPDQRTYCHIVTVLASDRQIKIPPAELERGAIQWALKSGGRSPRAAKQFVEWAEARWKKGLPVFD
jgi:predicted AAA+ superfamily ATPase